MAKYLITGASGTVGTEVIQALLNNKHEIRAASRHPEKSHAQFGDKIESITFDFENHSTFAPATEKIDGVFVLGPPLYPNLFNMLLPFVEHIIKQGPSRLVYLSAYGMEQVPEMPFHAQMEDKLKQSNLDWRVIRPGFFMQNLGNYERENIEQRKIIFIPAGEGKTAFISARDLGASIATLLTDDTYHQKTIELTGNEPMNYFDVAALLTEIRGEQIVYPNPDETTYRRTLSEAGAPDFVADYMIPVYKMIKDGKVAEVRDNTKKLTGHVPESLREVLKRDFSQK